MKKKNNLLFDDTPLMHAFPPRRPLFADSAPWYEKVNPAAGNTDDADSTDFHGYL
ncbi:MAG: hypothetical protein ACNA7I_06860 [Candidatus Methanoperedens sp.]